MSGKSDINIEKVATLARLELTPGEKEQFASQLGNILHYFERLNEVDVTGVEPTAHAFPVYNVWEEDEPAATFTPEEALANAPEQRDNQIVVPKVVE